MRACIACSLSEWREAWHFCSFTSTLSMWVSSRQIFSYDPFRTVVQLSSDSRAGSNFTDHEVDFTSLSLHPLTTHTIDVLLVIGFDTISLLITDTLEHTIIPGLHYHSVTLGMPKINFYKALVCPGDSVQPAVKDMWVNPHQHLERVNNCNSLHRSGTLCSYPADCVWQLIDISEDYQQDRNEITLHQHI